MASSASTAGRKLFVGSLPHNIVDATLRAEFSRFGTVEDVFVKPNCEMGRQWAFVTLSSPEAAALAKDACDRILHFPGAERPCDVMIAKGGPMDRQGAPSSATTMTNAPYGAPLTTGATPAPRKIFVGSLPQTITDTDIRNEFSKYGTIIDCHINNKPCEAGRQWCFITFADQQMAQLAKDSADKVTMFPGSEKPCEVTLARHQGMYGQDALGMDNRQMMSSQPVYTQAGAGSGPRKIFVGSLPQTVTNEILQAEFSKYGQVLDVHINYKACEAGRNWAFITFATAEQANYAKDATDRVLMVPGADRACEVMLAKNQGRNGQEPLEPLAPAAAAAVAATYAPPPAPIYLQPAAIPFGVQPPPPSVPPPPSLTPWRMYKTAAGLPYYHNHSTGQTQWECPPDLQVPGQGAYGAAAMAVHQHVHYAPY